MKINKRGQAWGIDLTIAVIIFSVGILIFFIYSVNQSREAKEILESLSFEGDSIVNSLLSEGYPADWNENDVVKIGILDKNQINETKLYEFYNLTLNNYPKTKSIFNTRYDYYFSFNNMTINSIEVEGIGKPGASLGNFNATNLLKITRFSIYKNKPVTVNLYIWEG